MCRPLLKLKKVPSHPGKEGEEGKMIKVLVFLREGKSRRCSMCVVKWKDVVQCWPIHVTYSITLNTNT